MHCGKCGGKNKHLCPFSFGLAVGITSFFAILIWSLWMMIYGLPPMMVAMHMHVPTGWETFIHALLGLLKGFLFGFFVAIFYDLFACCARGMCRKSEGEGRCQCGCGCECCSSSPMEVKRK